MDFLPQGQIAVNQLSEGVLHMNSKNHKWDIQTHRDIHIYK